jgi:hypothetical protein
LVGEQERVVEQLRSSLKELGLPELIITNPKDDNRNWGLRFENALSYSEAMKLRQKAIKYGFRDDSYLYRIKRCPNFAWCGLGEPSVKFRAGADSKSVFQMNFVLCSPSRTR